MIYLIFAHRIDSTSRPAHRWLEGVADTKQQAKINIGLLQKNYANRQPYAYEIVAVRHDGEFHLDVIQKSEDGK